MQIRFHDVDLQDPSIGDTLNEYINDIKSTMSGSFLEFYSREFDFFDSVTEISSIIKPFPKVSTILDFYSHSLEFRYLVITFPFYACIN